MHDETWRLKRTAQCAKCPWRVDVDPYDIPNGYTEEQHRALARTIAKPAVLSQLEETEFHVMACHETRDAHCIGWVVNQVGPGNNIRLRLQMRNCANADAIRLRGEQHRCFEDTLPKSARESLCTGQEPSGSS